MDGIIFKHGYIIFSNLLEKTTDAVIKAAKNGDLVMVSRKKQVMNVIIFIYLIYCCSHS